MRWDRQHEFAHAVNSYSDLSYRSPCSTEPRGHHFKKIIAPYKCVVPKSVGRARRIFSEHKPYDSGQCIYSTLFYFVTMTKIQKAGSIRKTSNVGETGQSYDGSRTAEDAGRVEFLNYWKERLKASRCQHSPQRVTILQNEAERTVVVKLLRMLDASQQSQNDKITERRQLREVLRMLSKARRVKLTMFDAHNKTIEQLQQEKEMEIHGVNQYWQRNLKKSKDLCDNYVEQNASLKRTISALKGQAAKQAEQWRHLEIENREKLIEEKIMLERKFSNELQGNQRHQNELQSDLLATQKKNRELIIREGDFEKEIKHRKQELEEARSRGEKHISNLLELEAEFSSFRSAHSIQVEKLTKESEADRQNFSKEQGMLKAQLKEIGTDYIQMQAAMEATQAIFDQQLADKTAYEQVLKEQNAILETQRHMLQEDLADLRKSFAEIQSKMKNLKSSHNIDMIEKTSFAQELNKEKGTLERENSVLLQQLEEARTSYSQVQSEMASAMATNDRELANKMSIENSLIAKESVLEEDKRVLLGQLEKESARHSQLYSQMATAKSRHEKEIEEMIVSKQEQNEENDRLGKEIIVLKEELEDTRISHSQLQSELVRNSDRAMAENLSSENRLNEFRAMLEIKQESVQSDVQAQLQHHDGPDESTSLSIASNKKDKHSQAHDIEDESSKEAREWDMQKMQTTSHDQRSILSDPGQPLMRNLVATSHFSSNTALDEAETSLEIGEYGQLRNRDGGAGVEVETNQVSQSDVLGNPCAEISQSIPPGQELRGDQFHSSRRSAPISPQSAQNIYTKRLHEQQALLEEIPFDSSNTSEHRLIETTRVMDAIAKDIQEEGGVQYDNENLEVEELRMRCQFLEHDRSELARVTNVRLTRRITFTC